MTNEAGNEAGGFLNRWSRRKQAGRAPEAAPAKEALAEEALAEEALAEEALAEKVGLELPPIEELGAASDYSVFLQKGVAAAVQARALSRAWTSDAGIAGFRGMADYDWDFNAVGYGRLWVSDDVPKLLAAILGPAGEGAPVVATAEVVVDGPSVRQSVPVPVPVASPAEGEAEPRGDDVLAEGVEAESGVPRRHGSALPA